MSTLWPHTPPVPCRRLRIGKGGANLLRARFHTMSWLRQMGVDTEPMPRAPEPCTHGNCVWIKSEERYDCEVYA